jgi:DNA-binding transcriptional regulator YdaS (Cro superfamily)
MSSVILKKNFIYTDSMKKHKSGANKNVAMEKAVLFFGGTLNLSKKLNTNRAHIYKWLNNERPIPLKHAIKIEQLTNGFIKAKELRSDVFQHKE